MNPQNRGFRVLHLSTYAAGGGAGRAAYALHQAQQQNGLDSTFMNAAGKKFILTRALDRSLWKVQSSPIKTWRSPAKFGSLSAKSINDSDVDVVNLHWVTDGFLTIEEIGKITKPLVWSLYDMWPFSGTQHYGTYGPGARWRTGYEKTNRPKEDSGIDLDRWTWQRKQRHWSRPIPIIAASTWMQNSIQASALMNSWPTHRIPHVIDCEIFQPIEQEHARTALNLPSHIPLVLFMSSAGVMDPRKGFDLIQQAWPAVQQRFPEAKIIVVGPKDPTHPFAQGLPIIWRGNIEGDEALKNYYNAANVIAVPSREDNMPLTAMEAQSCGRAVVAFKTGGLPNIIEQGHTGSLAEPFNTTQLGTALIDAITDSRGSNELGRAARDHAIRTWSAPVIAGQYQAIYEALIT